MRRIGIVLMLLVVLIGCSPSSQIPGSTHVPTQEQASTPMQDTTPGPGEGIVLTDAQELVDEMKALCCKEGWWDHLFKAEGEANRNGEEFDIGADFLERLEAAGERFDPNQYLTVLTHLAVEDGYVLDYVYFAPGGDGFPYLYARREGEPPLATYSDYQKAAVENYLNHVRVDGTAEGYYELALLSLMGGQFYLSWHANYNDREVVSSQERLKAIIEWLNEKYRPLTEEQVEAVLHLDVAPRVKFEDDKVQVRVVVFTKWGGFYERVYTIDRNFPHQMMDEDNELVPYNCGIVF
jgi:hypothetical protein